MPVLKIRKFKDPVLRDKAQRVEQLTEKIRQIARDMAETMLKSDGIGLAAPQIGENKRIIVIRAGVEGPDVLVLINPVIINRGPEKETGEEGCLSFPGVFLKIKRAKKVGVEGLNIAGEKIKIEVRGLTARVFQHEIDHLDGILFVDRLNFGQKIKFNLNRLIRGFNR